MNPIYVPKNRAREFSPRALNIYIGECAHQCSYCYIKSLPGQQYRNPAIPRKDLLPGLEKQLSKEQIKEQVLISFICDPYGHENEIHGMTRKVLEILLAHNVPVAILTKGGPNCLKDLDIFRRFGASIKVGASLTFYSPEDSLKFEPGAALPEKRFETLKVLYANGIRTFASLEPIINTDQTLKIIQETHHYVDHYKVGKINHCPELENPIDWDRFLSEAVTVLRSLSKKFYVKKSLQERNRSTALRPEEIDPDLLCVSPL